MLVVLAMLLTQIGPGDPPPAPTPEETLALELVNRMRADPVGEAARLLADRPRPAYQGFDAEMFTKELSAMPAVAPLVFHPRLIAAGRNHSAYTAKHREYGHGETEGREGFTGKTGTERARFAGYPESHGVAFENAGSFIPGGVYGSHWGCAVDDGPGGAGGMQARRGHRKTMMDARWREFGCGFVFHADGRAEHSSLFGDGAGHRLVGGVAFIDLDGDGFYDVGEGLGGVRITLDNGAVTASWSSGAYAVDPGASKGAGRARWTARLHDVELRADLGSGEANVKQDAELLAAIRSRWTQLHAAVSKRRGAARERALHDLAFWTAALPQIQPDFTIADDVVAVRSTWIERRDRLVEGLTAGTLATGDFASTYPRDSLPDAWLREAARIHELDADRARLEAPSSNDATRARRVPQLLRAFEKLREDLEMPSLFSPLGAVGQRISALGE